MSTYDNPDTPFDALAEEKAQRPTQPLPPRPGSPHTRGGKLPVPTGELNDYGDLPEDDDDDVTAPVAAPNHSRASLSTPVAATGPLMSMQRLRQTPTSLLVGFSVVAGALLVVIVSLAMNALVPKPPVNQDGMVGDLGPQVTVLRDELENPDGLGSNDDVIVEVVPSPEEEILVAEREGEAGEESSTASEEDMERRERSREDDRSRDDESSREEERSARSERERERDTENKGRTFTHSEKGYQITVPKGFALRDEGRRTIWKGPDDAQLLVETVSSPDGSPREGWEQLHKNLSRKYGSRYRNLGIRETTLAGRPAAIWEFELTEKDGKKVRKIDVGVHHNDTGYAVLGAAPVEKFKELRPQLERAIRSLQLPEKTSRDEARSTQSEPKRDTRERDTRDRDTSERRVQRSESSSSSKSKSKEKTEEKAEEEVIGY